MSLGLDGSAALAWCFEDEGTPAVDSMMERVAEQGAIVPALWRLEVANGLQVAVRRGRLDPAKRDSLLSALPTLTSPPIPRPIAMPGRQPFNSRSSTS